MILPPRDVRAMHWNAHGAVQATDQAPRLNHRTLRARSPTDASGTSRNAGAQEEWGRHYIAVIRAMAQATTLDDADRLRAQQRRFADDLMYAPLSRPAPKARPP